MYCPNCAAQANEGQRYCRNCGINLGVIVDAMEGKRGPVDVEALKEDLRQLGLNLRAGYEEAKREFTKTQHFDRRRPRKRRGGERAGETVQRTVEAATEAATEAVTKAVCAVAAPRADKVKARKQPHSRRYSLQQAMLSIFGGAAGSAALYYLLNTAANSGLLASLERVIVTEAIHRPDIVGIAPVLSMLWILGLVGVAKGFAHLINGIFFAPRAGEGEQTFVLSQPTGAAERGLPQPSIPATVNFGDAQSPELASVKAPTTNELDGRWAADFRPSVTEEETVRLGARERQAEPK
jgi:hypothetical protein